ncbi:M20 metallopeptidase family protein [Salirhabdus sp. Marseille-P4669]|uniref:M20 metallopeptidase family protein n=1 Tax=Salirhabdus sp. Marseille-P4669 TaxID=2042310 RepID=UPI001F30297B|nr:M20 family metallopeptidase [Salirhabdus sp. Marseille-P4669]
MSFLEQAIEIKKELIRSRRQLHQYPELSFKEFETTAFLVKKLQAIKGMIVLTGVERVGLPTGVIGILSSGNGPTIAVRADIDALPITEENHTNYTSKNNGVMHACGHDAHTSILLGTATLLAEKMRKKELSGTIKFIFQPAEEDIDVSGLTGSPHLIQAGVLNDVDVALALHVNPEQPVGEVLVNSGYSMASVDTFKATIQASGGHAAYPHLATDPIWMLGNLLQAIQGIVARKISPLEPSVLSVTHVETTPSFNVIPNEVTLQGTIRSYNPDIRIKLQEELRNTCHLISVLGGEYKLEINQGEPVLYNHPVVIYWLTETISDLLPNFKINIGPYGLGGEDFSHMLEKVPGAMFFLGAKVDERENGGLHMPQFDVNEEALVYGAAIMAETVTRYLNGNYTLSLEKEEKGADMHGT